MSETSTIDASTDTELTTLKANNILRREDYACLRITETVQGDTVETVFIAVDRIFFKVTEFGLPSKCKRHTMAEALTDAQNNPNKHVEIAAYGQSSLDLSSAENKAREHFDLATRDSRAGRGLSRDELDEVGEDNMEVSVAPAREDEGW